MEQIVSIEQLVAASSSFLEPYEIKSKGILKIKTIFQTMLQTIMKMQIPKSEKGIVKPGEFIIELFTQVGITTKNCSTIRELLEVIANIVSGNIIL